MKDELEYITQRVRSVRKSKGLTQVELASLAGTTSVTVSRCEQGGNCTVDTLLQICHALKLSIVLIELQKE